MIYNNEIKSPCIKVCKLENEVCVGCKRTRQEIANWSKYTDKEKLEIILKIKDTLA